MKRAKEWFSGVIAPLIFIAVILEADTLEGPKTAYVGVLSVVPMFSAVFGTPLMTALVAVLTLLSGYAYGLSAADGNVQAQNVRLMIIGLVGIIAIIAAVTRRRMQRALLTAQVAAAQSEVIERQANTDSLTGLLNRRGLTKFLEGQEPGPRSLAILDCDQLKAVNDSYGHVVGDEYIRAIAQRLKNGVSQRDAVARWGGDEFLVLVAAPADEAHAVTRRLLAKIADTPISTEGGPITATVTAGVAEWSDSQTLDQTLQRADAALYEAKGKGRGQLAVAPPAVTSS